MLDFMKSLGRVDTYDAGLPIEARVYVCVS